MTCWNHDFSRHALYAGVIKFLRIEKMMIIIRQSSLRNIPSSKFDSNKSKNFAFYQGLRRIKIIVRWGSGSAPYESYFAARERWKLAERYSKIYLVSRRILTINLKYFNLPRHMFRNIWKCLVYIVSLQTSVSIIFDIF